MKFAGALVGRLKTFALLRLNVQNCRVIQLGQRLEQFYKRANVMAVNRTKVWNIQALKHLAGRQGHPDTFLNPLNRFLDTFAYKGCML